MASTWDALVALEEKIQEAFFPKAKDDPWNSTPLYELADAIRDLIRAEIQEALHPDCEE